MTLKTALNDNVGFPVSMAPYDAKDCWTQLDQHNVKESDFYFVVYWTFLEMSMKAKNQMLKIAEQLSVCYNERRIVFP